MSLKLILLAVSLVVPSLALLSSKRRKTTNDGPECQHDRESALANYRSGNANLWFYHITHHAGTTLVDVMHQNGLEESAHDSPYEPNWPTDSKSFHMWGETMFNWVGHLPKTGLNSVLPCNSDAFVSIILMREPISRILSSDGMWTTNATDNLDQCNTDNYGIRWLTGVKYGEGEITKDDLALAKQRIDMFDVVVIFEELGAGVRQMCAELGWDQSCELEIREHQNPADVLPSDVLADLQGRNRFDIELYEYAVARARRQGMTTTAADTNLMAVSAAASKGALAVASEANQRWLC